MRKTSPRDRITFHGVPLVSSSSFRFGFRRLTALLVAFAILLVSTLAAAAWTPPPLNGHVVDQAGALDETQIRHLDKKLDRARRQTGFAIVVLLLPQLPESMTIEDVGYTAGNTWGVGSKTGADGVLLIASLAERKLRIETGKGVGGALTDVQSSHINREVIGPLMKEGKTFEAMDKGVDAIIKELVENTPGGTSDPGKDPKASRKPRGTVPGTPAPAPTVASYVKIGVIALIIIGVIVLAFISPAFREILFWVLLFGRFGGGGGGGGRGGRDDDDSGSGYGGGGGTFGGGGSSDDY
jgi:uncharacterized protein